MQRVNKLDLKAACLWAGLTVSAALLTDSPLLRGVFGVPLALVIVGHAIVRAVGVPTATWTQHVSYCVAASLACCILGGFALHALRGLNPTGWVLLMAGLASVASGWAGLQRTLPPLPPSLRGIPNFRLWHGLSLTAAGLIVVAAMALAVEQEHRHREFRYTAFWLVPQNNTAQLILGVRSAEISGQRFDVEVVLNGRLFASFPGLIIDPGETWTHSIPVPALGKAQMVQARLYRAQDNLIYRQVSARVPSAF